MLRVSWGVHLETIKALGLRLLAFTCFSVGLEPLMKPSHSFLYISSKVWLNALLVFRLALCFASDDPRTSCLFTNTAHLIRYVLTCRHTLLYKDLFSLITHLKPVGGGGGGGIPGNLWWGCAARLSKSWSYFRPKKVIFHTRRQTCRKQKLCYHYLD